MERIVRIKEGKYLQSLITQVRSEKTEAKELQKVLENIGNIFGSEIIGEEFTEISAVNTPMNEKFQGLKINYKNVMIVGTKDDFSFFLRGIAKLFPNAILGHMDFHGQRGLDTYTAGNRSLVIPEVGKGAFFDALIIAKSVLATGCTAVSLAKEAMSEIMPAKLIIASCFYSSRGVQEIHAELPQAKLYLLGNPDILDDNGMLVPGVGNIDARLKNE